MQRKQDKKLLPYMIGAVVGTAAVLTLALMWFLPWWRCCRWASSWARCSP